MGWISRSDLSLLLSPSPSFCISSLTSSGLRKMNKDPQGSGLWSHTWKFFLYNHKVLLPDFSCSVFSQLPEVLSQHEDLATNPNTNPYI